MRECDGCDSEVESLMHFYVECQSLKDYHELLKQCVRKNWEEIKFVDKEWGRMFLFGMVQEKKVRGNVQLLNMMLSFARYAVRLRRNVAYFEKRKENVWCIFRTLIKQHIKMIKIYMCEEFCNFFVEGSKFISVTELNELVFNF